MPSPRWALLIFCVSVCLLAQVAPAGAVSLPQPTSFLTKEDNRAVRIGRWWRMTVRPGDKVTVGGERSEAVYMLRGQGSGMDRWYAWSTYFGRNFRSKFRYWDIFTLLGGRMNNPRTPHSNIGFDLSTERRIMVWVRGGRPGAVKSVGRAVARWQRSRRYDFVVHARWSASRKGLVEVWVNGRRKMSVRHPTWYAGRTGGVRIQQGHYRGPRNAASTRINPTSVVYHAGFRHSSTKRGIFRYFRRLHAQPPGG